MDKELLDSVIKIVTEDKERVNEYDHFDKLLLTLSDEEVIYFLNCCDEDVFLNETLSWMLIKTVPELLKNYLIEFVKDRLDMVDNMERCINQKFIDGEISKSFYDETIKEYQHIRESASKFSTLYLKEIEREINNKKLKV
jgi:hypothetical protein